MIPNTFSLRSSSSVSLFLYYCFRLRPDDPPSFRMFPFLRPSEIFVFFRSFVQKRTSEVFLDRDTFGTKILKREGLNIVLDEHNKIRRFHTVKQSRRCPFIMTLVVYVDVLSQLESLPCTLLYIDLVVYLRLFMVQ